MNRCTILPPNLQQETPSTHPWWLQTSDVERISSTSQGDAVVCLGLWEFEHFVVRLSLFLTHIPTLHREPSKKNVFFYITYRIYPDMSIIYTCHWMGQIWTPLRWPVFGKPTFFVIAAKQHEPPQSSLHSRMGHPKKTISVLPLVQTFSSQKKRQKSFHPNANSKIRDGRTNFWPQI